MDAVFHPKCVTDRRTFEQEGWHYELDAPKARGAAAAAAGPAPPAPAPSLRSAADSCAAVQGMLRRTCHTPRCQHLLPSAPSSHETHPTTDTQGEISYKGVVFNEMKGVYSSPDSIYYRAVQQSLFADNTYRHDSGGDPAQIPGLTYEQFQGFHAKYYHPSNAKCVVAWSPAARAARPFFFGFLQGMRGRRGSAAPASPAPTADPPPLSSSSVVPPAGSGSTATTSRRSGCG